MSCNVSASSVHDASNVVPHFRQSISQRLALVFSVLPILQGLATPTPARLVRLLTQGHPFLAITTRISLGSALVLSSLLPLEQVLARQTLGQLVPLDPELAHLCLVITQEHRMPQPHSVAQINLQVIRLVASARTQILKQVPIRFSATTINKSLPVVSSVTIPMLLLARVYLAIRRTQPQILSVETTIIPKLRACLPRSRHPPLEVAVSSATITTALPHQTLEASLVTAVALARITKISRIQTLDPVCLAV